jgi:hypothetical protein
MIPQRLLPISSTTLSAFRTTSPAVCQSQVKLKELQYHYSITPLLPPRIATLTPQLFWEVFAADDIYALSFFPEFLKHQIAANSE